MNSANPPPVTPLIEPSSTRCPACGQGFTCGVEKGNEHCWCMTLPAKVPEGSLTEGRCLCPQCLAKLADQLGG